MEMRTGNLWKNIVLYSLPLMFTNLLQVFFNLADVAVAGQFAGSIALGAVGSTTILISLTTNWSLGMGNGVNALTARYIGADDNERVKKCLQTGFWMCLATGIIVLTMGQFLAEPVLRMLGTKDELIADAIVYFKIYMLGSPAVAIYNYGNAVLSAAGDTKKPLKYLTAAGIVNVILNLVFVIVFHLGAAGVGISSVISQYLSAGLIFRDILTTDRIYRMRPNLKECDGDILKNMLKIGVPSLAQYSLFSVSNLFVQSAVNTFDHVVVEGNSAALNLDTIEFEMLNAFYIACTSFIAQNYGAKNADRIMKVYIVTTVYSFVFSFVTGLLFYFFRVPLLSIFTNDPEVIQSALTRVAIMALSYCISPFMDNAIAAARGLGQTAVPTVIVILGTVVFRIIWIYTIFAYFHTLPSLYLLYTIAWFLTAIAENIYFFREYGRVKKRFAVK